MEIDRGCAGDGNAVQCLVLVGYDGIPTSYEALGGGGAGGGACPAEVLLFTDSLFAVCFSI